MLPIRSGSIGAMRYALLGIALSVAGCMAGGPGAEESEAQGEAAALGIAPLPIAPACSSDADCQVVPDYCADCSCVALGAQQHMPECLGEELTCVLNPCADHVARCIQGHCSADSGALR